MSHDVATVPDVPAQALLLERDVPVHLSSGTDVNPAEVERRWRELDAAYAAYLDNKTPENQERAAAAARRVAAVDKFTGNVTDVKFAAVRRWAHRHRRRDA